MTIIRAQIGAPARCMSRFRTPPLAPTAMAVTTSPVIGLGAGRAASLEQLRVLRRQLVQRADDAADRHMIDPEGPDDPGEADEREGREGATEAFEVGTEVGPHH